MARARTSVVAVFDVGKTHVKLLVIDPEVGEVIDALQTDNRPVDKPPYLHVDADAIFAWLIEALREASGRFPIEAIIPCAYGSTAALIDAGGMVLPMMDYEAEPPLEVKDAYAAAAPPFEEVCCPINPGGLTLGRQLFWQSRHFPKCFARARWIVPAAQYWAWRLTGLAASEVTSLGAQTQLWNPRDNSFSSLAVREGWTAKLPPLCRAYDPLGRLRSDLAQSLARLGSSPPMVLVGIHDSNANYARYLAAGIERFTLISSGTWLITFRSGAPLDRLEAERDMVSNTDLEGRPVACTRFMGGREFAALAGEDGLRAEASVDDVGRLVARETMALPSFPDSGGPFPGTGNRGRIAGPPPETARERAALASLYVALMASVDLELLASTERVIIDGSFADNPLFTGLLAALHPQQPVLVSKARDGTALGAAQLWRWPQRAEIDLEPVAPARIDGLDRYALAWRRAAAG